ncbi:hypothetical protein BLOT_011172 [Blomia tropicalis]|nr:hypothetical protein BLOT_011172 [Blomia tropicalis]
MFQTRASPAFGFGLGEEWNPLQGNPEGNETIKCPNAGFHYNVWRQCILSKSIGGQRGGWKTPRRACDLQAGKS